ncbi:MAG: hypothetical protein ABRQ39_29335 [Candidatus Eremiobacterota bacterium]
MDLSVSNRTYLNVSYFQEVKQKSSMEITKEKEDFSYNKSVTISQEARFFASINSEKSQVKISFSMKREEKTEEFFDWSSEDPVMKKLLMLLDYLSEIKGKDLKENFLKQFKSLSDCIKNRDSNMYRVEKDITRARSLEMTVNFTFDIQSGRAIVQVEGAMADPLVLDLNGNGIETTTLQQGINFDINGDGTEEKTAFVTGGDGLLALDRNHDGKITSGTELFGDQNGAEDGFMELAKFDSNNDSVINRDDPVFKDLKVMIVTGKNSELYSLDRLDISEISLAGKNKAGFYNNGNYIKETTNFKRSDGSQGITGEVFFRYKVNFYS